ncbi:MAG: recombinase family protein [Candidatus Pacebacteria bacterium]|jgi:DNA invertase Pin-like site-specific DNA recombinase|nr:recombinase family protein [Candidatus Paceibacterota bacterium]
METQYISNLGVKTEIIQAKVRYVLYARKSTESDEKQALSIESQVKEMLTIADRDGLTVVDIRRESHSAKESGQRPVFKELLEDVRRGRYTGILTWAPDRLSRNAGDLGSVVDLMDENKLIEIRTYGQHFKNSPNEKFLLMILCSQAKLENDNKSINVKRGLRTRCEMGLRPGPAVVGYLNEKRMDKKCEVVIDHERAPIVKQMFEKVAYEKWSGRKVFHWLKFDLNFKTRNGNKGLTLSNIYLILQNPIYYGVFEYPKKSGNFYTGKHEPIISKELYDQVQGQVKSQVLRIQEPKEFAFTKMMSCGLCDSGICADEKFKKLKDGSVNRHVYYSCTKSKDKYCKCGYVNEVDLIDQFEKLLDRINISEIGMKDKIKSEVERIKRFNQSVLNIKQQIQIKDVDIRDYAKFILKDGAIEEKRELLTCFKSKILLKEKQIYIS